MKARAHALFAIVLAASMSMPAAAAGDPEAGRLKADTCMGCHGIPGYSNAYPTYRVPKIGGQSAGYLASALRAYKSGERQHPTMNGQALSLSETDIDDIAAWMAVAPNKE